MPLMQSRGGSGSSSPPFTTTTRLGNGSGTAAASTSPSSPPPRILFLDAYDSFTNNIVSLLKDALGADVQVHVIHMDLRTLHSDPTPDWTPDQFLARLASFDAVVCGPGPGSPLCANDVGAFRHLWDLSEQHRSTVPPVFGICLGFQSLVEHFGGRIRKLRRGLHGMVRSIDHKGLERPAQAAKGGYADIFEGVPPFRATLYHSLCADIGQDDVPDEQWPLAKWQAPSVAPDLVPLAWVTEADNDNERVLMGVRHASMPFWGVQCHPESICTDSVAVHGILRNWFDQATKWNEVNGRARRPWNLPLVHSASLESSAATGGAASTTTQGPSERDLASARWSNAMRSGLASQGTQPGYVCRQLKLPDCVDAADVMEILGCSSGEAILLDSSSAKNGDPLARNSIIALDVDAAIRLEYHVRDDYVTFRRPASNIGGGRPEEVQRISLDDTEDDPMAVYQIMSEYWKTHKLQDADCDGAPAFKGGFMGFVTYEMGLSTLSPGAVSAHRGHHRPDLVMAWITNSVVLDHKTSTAYVQSLTTADHDGGWVDEAVRRLQNAPVWRDSNARRPVSCPEATFTPEELWDDVAARGSDRLDITVPDSGKYEDDVRRCQYAIREGHSYELCLTAQTTMTRPPVDDDDERRSPWEVYRTLRSRQPAPFGSFVRLGGATVVSCSPERFLSTDRAGLCRMRPMKGTVRKSAAVPTLAAAERILHVPKEEAENLMIVDLVRHDLHGVCGPQNVSVPDLLKVEEYATVFQMVTAVHGQLPPGAPLNGIDVLAATLPPGSMTGAPKKRSCELLRVIEPGERSVYSGVVGYFDVQGQGDWSVTIRTMFRWDDEQADGGEDEEGRGREVWRIGAGGAVTILSTPEGEREEMFTKLFGPLGTFRDAA
ncbi:para-aminobenzoate synthase PabaA [Cordyceps fumosorosea ARSEF 2679]|uniref:aminodeoxychorismate synthase n=1 Tax=Cordyceps fumosorosea (strain ARSEF 2679) TaxID=1081104 RepID=A0A168CLB6_CORFA|nr:para-aminobenzoate synthase PabaA [Cordyceps fumosorosea ARSEF 2679]OAA71518.1 para-aminobenzoate synthase PabaA [Cordyceps fumosorosea ARSEF 2679]